MAAGIMSGVLKPISYSFQYYSQNSADDKKTNQQYSLVLYRVGVFWPDSAQWNRRGTGGFSPAFYYNGCIPGRILPFSVAVIARLLLAAPVISHTPASVMYTPTRRVPVSV
jgi:hypothetical protein